MNATTSTSSIADAFADTLECLDRFVVENNEKNNASSTEWLKGWYAGRADAFKLAAHWIRSDLERITT